MTKDKSLNQFYIDLMEEVEMASEAETIGWTKDDFLTSIMLEYLEEAGDVTDPIMCPFRSYGLQLNAYAISEDYSSYSKNDYLDYINSSYPGFQGYVQQLQFYHKRNK